MLPKVRILDYDKIEYNKALTIQEELRHSISIKEEDNTILLLEHPPTITFGIRINRKNLLVNEKECKNKGIELVETSRGGDITFHGPGQLIIYPILNLKDFNFKIITLIDMIEQTIISALKKFNLNGITNTQHKGVWIENKKIASIGLNIKKHISIHGAALNVNTDLSYFNLINPCGLNVSMTSMKNELNHEIDMAEIKAVWVEVFKKYINANIEYVG